VEIVAKIYRKGEFVRKRMVPKGSGNSNADGGNTNTGDDNTNVTGHSSPGECNPESTSQSSPDDSPDDSDAGKDGSMAKTTSVSSQGSNKSGNNDVDVVEEIVKFEDGGKCGLFLEDCGVGDDLKISGPYGRIVYQGMGERLILFNERYYY
jgi:hypothetical protein